MKTIIEAYCDPQSAQNAVGQLRATDLQASCQLVEDSQQAPGLIDELTNRGVPADLAESYAELLRRGAPVVICEGPDDNASTIAKILDRENAIDVERARERWRSAGWTGYQAGAEPLDTEAMTREREALSQESIPVIQEEVVVGKREVPAEGMRVRAFVIERPVREQVPLREEHVEVKRQPADERVPAEAAEAAFTEQEFVVEATGEEPVVEKRARVVERVTVEKRPETRTETVEATERRREVEAEPIEPPPAEPSKGEPAPGEPQPPRH